MNLHTKLGAKVKSNTFSYISHADRIHTLLTFGRMHETVDLGLIHANTVILNRESNALFKAFDDHT
ncbi:hypothetical protein D3C78_1765130 [compost metagenome]